MIRRSAAGAGIEQRWRADCRYAGQPASIAVDLDASVIEGAQADIEALRAQLRMGFEQNHKRMWNFIKPDQPVILTNLDRKSTRLNSSHIPLSRMPSSA